jgi:hypothetical protein
MSPKRKVSGLFLYIPASFEKITPARDRQSHFSALWVEKTEKTFFAQKH